MAPTVVAFGRKPGRLMISVLIPAGIGVALLGAGAALQTVRRFGGLTPLAIFIAVELAVVWPAAVLAVLREERYWDITMSTYVLALFVLLLTHTIVWHALSPRLHTPQTVRARRAKDGNVVEWNYAWFLFLGLGGVLLLVSILLYRGPPPLLIAIVSALGAGDVVEAARMMGQARVDLTRWEARGEEWRGQGALATTLRLGWPVVIGALLISKRSRGAPLRRWLAISVTLIVAVFSLAGAGQRAPLVYAAVAVMVAVSWARPIRVSRGMATYVIAVGVLVAGISFVTPKFQAVRGSDSPVREALAALVERVAVGNGRNNLVIIDRIESHALPIQRGAIHYQRFGNALPGVRVRQSFSNYLAQIETRDHRRMSQHSATYIGYLYAEGRVPAVLLGYALMGLALGLATAVAGSAYSRHGTKGIPWIATWVGMVGLITLFDFSGVLAGTAVLASLAVLVALARRGVWWKETAMSEGRTILAGSPGLSGDGDGDRRR
jgi:hypothetical protein